MALVVNAEALDKGYFTVCVLTVPSKCVEATHAEMYHNVLLVTALATIGKCVLKQNYCTV